MIPVAVAGLIAVPLLVRAWRAAPSGRRSLQATVVIATLLLVGATCMGDMVVTTIGINLAALGLAAAALWIGIVDERRSVFWAGTLFAVLLVVSRFLEFNSSLLLKSMAFITCGLTVMFAGRAYEHLLGRRGVAT